VFSKDSHTYNEGSLITATDPGMHRIATAAMRGYIYNKMEKINGVTLATGTLHSWKRGIFKGRLPIKEYQHLYVGLKFLIFCTGGMESEEVYFVWWANISDEELEAKRQNMLRIYARRKSSAIQLWCAAITNLDQLERFVVTCYQMKVVFCASVMQIPMLRMDTVVDYKFYRDWDVPHNCMPVVYGDKSMKPFLPSHVTKAMARAEEMELSAWDAGQLRFQTYKEEAENEKPTLPRVEVKEVTGADIFQLSSNRTFEATVKERESQASLDFGASDDVHPPLPDPQVSHSLPLPAQIHAAFPSLPPESLGTLATTSSSMSPELLQFYDTQGFLLNFHGMDADSLAQEIHRRLDVKHSSMRDTEGVMLRLQGMYFVWYIEDGAVRVDRLGIAPKQGDRVMELRPIGEVPIFNLFG